MSLIINPSALADFQSDGVDTQAVLTYFNVMISALSSVVELAAMSFDNVQDPNMPSNLNSDCQIEWTAQYEIYLTDLNDSKIANLNILSFSNIVSLFDATPSDSASRADVVEQLESTLQIYPNTAVSAFLVSMQE